VIPTTNTTILNAGDVLGTWGSSVAGLVVTHVLTEF